MNDTLAADGLLAPLTIVRFALAYLAVAIVPGYALATVARPAAGRSERLVLAIPCAYALVAVCGLVTALLRLPFTLGAYGALALPVTLAGAALWWRTRDTEAAWRVDSPWILAPLGVALAQLAVIALVFARYIVPPYVDVVSHVLWTDLIARSHLYPIAIMSSAAGANDGGFYPPVFHALSALVLALAPMATPRAVFLGTLAPIALLPLALFVYVRAATGRARLGGLATLASLAFAPLPYAALTQGLCPFIVSLLIAPALALALRPALAGGDRRALALATALGVALFYTHPTEFITAALLSLVVVAPLLDTAGAWARAVGYGIVVAMGWVAAALPARAAVHRTMVTGVQAEIHWGHLFSGAPRASLSTALRDYIAAVFGVDVGYLLLVAVAIGAAWCLLRRRQLLLVSVHACLVAVFVDSHLHNILQPFYNLSFPWALTPRQAPTAYWTALPLAAIGIDLGLRAFRRVLRRTSILFAAIAASPAVIIGLGIPLWVATGATAVNAQALTVLGPADLDALQWLTGHAGPDTVVVDDVQAFSDRGAYWPADAGLWMPALGVAHPLFWRANAGPGAAEERLYLLVHVADAPLPPRAARYVARYHVRYVFYGATVLPGTARHLRLARLLADPALRLVYTTARPDNRRSAQAGQSASAMSHSPALPDGRTCRDDHDHASCPSPGAYVFALRAEVRVQAWRAMPGHLH